MTLRFKNVGKETVLRGGGPLWHVVIQRSPDVRDAAGKAAENPYSVAGPMAIDGPSIIHELKPGGEVTYRRLLNEGVPD